MILLCWPGPQSVVKISPYTFISKQALLEDALTLKVLRPVMSRTYFFDGFTFHMPYYVKIFPWSRVSFVSNSEFF